MLHNVNLLPWRDELRARHKKRFLQLVLLGALLAFGLQWIAGNYLEQQSQQQYSRISYLKSYIGQLDKQIHALKKVEQEHKALLTRLSVVEQLQVNRNKTTDFMNAVPLLIPDGVYVDKIKMNGQRIEIAGISDTTSRLATMLDNLEKSAQLKNVEMHSIVHGKIRFGKKFQVFNVSFVFASSTVKKGEQNG
ncbi:PilN domain-containing protein [Vibrio sp. RE86]|uniref:PilN domain-containing protein n=1 Tax=Vibrio sp. RE86 TaxID=2607605 RepID=UPI001493665C|nr:PilN domain-containing protein [Vibrio sp. RE86]NOH81673.1 PilN domain-containing protein [Vibrio sp. RE86]